MASWTSSGSTSRSDSAANTQTKQTGSARESTSRNSRRPLEAPEDPQLSALLSSVRRPNDSTSVQSLLQTAGSTASSSSVQSSSAACESSTSVTTSSSTTSAAGGASGVVVGQRIAKKRAAGGSIRASDDESDNSDDGDLEEKNSDRFDERQLGILNHWWNSHADHYPSREEKELLAIQSTPFLLI